MQEYLWLLLPVAAASGWYAARRSAARQPQKNFADEEYFRGLNYLLDNRPDKAIEVFVRMVEVDQDTVETHLALGNLFRRRGEVDRAIQIHQNLIARSGLNVEQRARALLELGEDYMKAGVYDRAEGLFKELVANDAFVSQALQHLLTIYQQERDWHAAIATGRRLEQISEQQHHHETAHFYCELASEARRQADEAGAERLVRQARREDPVCVRASLLAASLKMDRGQYRGAIRMLKTIAAQDPRFIPETLAPLQQCYRAMDRETDIIEYLRGLLESHPSGYLTAALADLLNRFHGVEAAEQFLVEALRQHPSVPGLRRLIELKLDRSGREDLRPILEAGRELLDSKLCYQCSHCGFEGRSLHWRCPGCQSWNTVRPKDVFKSPQADREEAASGAISGR